MSPRVPNDVRGAHLVGRHDRTDAGTTGDKPEPGGITKSRNNIRKDAVCGKFCI